MALQLSQREDGGFRERESLQSPRRPLITERLQKNHIADHGHA
jgi:hypothetical protein